MKTIKQAAPWLLAALCLVASALHLTETMRSFDLSKDMVSSWEEHMKLIRDAIPEDVFMVGYLERADIPDSTVQLDSAEFFLTQYGIAPLVLTRGYGQEWTIGNFGGNVPLESLSAWLDQRLGNHAIQDLGFGIYIIHDLEN